MKGYTHKAIRELQSFWDLAHTRELFMIIETRGKKFLYPLAGGLPVGEVTTKSEETNVQTNDR